MATLTARPNGTFQALIRRKGFASRSKIFSSKSEALKWARGIESDMDRGLVVALDTFKQPTFREALVRYLAEVTPLKKGWQQEGRRIAGLRRNCGFLSKTLQDITPLDLSKFVSTRQSQTTKRGSTVTGSTVNRDLALISHVYQTAMKRWMVPNLTNPVTGIARCKENRPRDRRLISPDGQDELNLILEKTYSLKVKIAFELLVELACRRSELTNLAWPEVSLSGRTVTFKNTKNGDSRTIPMSRRAHALLSQLKEETGESGPVLGLSANTLSDAWAKARRRAGVQGARLHDLRREGTSRLFEDVGLGTLEVASITGHRSLSMLARYTNLQTKNLLIKMDQAQAQAQADTQAGSQAEVSHV